MLRAICSISWANGTKSSSDRREAFLLLAITASEVYFVPGPIHSSMTILCLTAPGNAGVATHEASTNFTPPSGRFLTAKLSDATEDSVLVGDVLALLESKVVAVRALVLHAGTAVRANDEVRDAAHREVLDLVVTDVLDELLVHDVRGNEDVAVVDPRIADVDLAENGVENVALGVLGILEVLDEVEGTDEGLVRELEDFVRPSVIVVVDQVGALGLNQV